MINSDQKLGIDNQISSEGVSVDLAQLLQDEAPEFQPAGSKRGIKGSTLSCHHLNYTVSVTPPGAKCFAGKKPKMILCDVK